MKFLVFSETPVIQTGAGNVARHILQFMTDFGHTVEVCAINHHTIEAYDQTLYPYKIHESPKDDILNIRKMKELIRKGEYDALFLYADVGPLNMLVEEIREAKSKRNFPVIIYTCADCDELNFPTMVGLLVADHIITYSEHSRRIVQKYVPALRVWTIYHGCEPDMFFPLSEEQRREVRKNTFGIEDDTFLVLNVNRNQWRKDMGRSLMIFHEFHKHHPKSLLAMHSRMQDIGGNLPTMANIIGCRLDDPDREVAFPPPNFNEQTGVPREALNCIYNAADVLMSTTTGEGWGLTITEAMAAGLPVVIPRNSSCIEIVGANEERGYLADSGGDIDHMYIPYGFSDNPRPIVHARSMLQKMTQVYQYRDEAKAKAALARQWAEKHTWEHIKEQWRALFAKVGQ